MSKTLLAHSCFERHFNLYIHNTVLTICQQIRAPHYHVQQFYIGAKEIPTGFSRAYAFVWHESCGFHAAFTELLCFLRSLMPRHFKLYRDKFAMFNLPIRATICSSSTSVRKGYFLARVRLPMLPHRVVSRLKRRLRLAVLEVAIRRIW